MKKFAFKLTALIAAMSVLTAVTSITANASPDKVVICHVPPGNPNNKHSIEISMAALTPHLEHGDSIDYCPTEISATHVTGNATHIPTVARPVRTFTMRSISGS